MRVSLPSDRSFQAYDTALAHITGPPLPDDNELSWEQVILDAWLEYPIASDRSRFAINPGLRPLAQRVTIALRLLTPDGATAPSSCTTIRASSASTHGGIRPPARFVRSGFGHILDGIDHLLFLLCLVIPLRRMRTLVAVVTSFTVAHSITLIASAYDVAPAALWFPPLVETLIAASIVYMALENIVGANVDAALDHHVRVRPRARLRVLVRAARDAAVRRVAPADGAAVRSTSASSWGSCWCWRPSCRRLNLLFRFVVAERMGTIILSALVAHTAWHWMTERGAQLLQFPWPAVDAVLLSDNGSMDDGDRRAGGGDLARARAGQTEGRAHAWRSTVSG